jgi:hypothetical protein
VDSQGVVEGRDDKIREPPPQPSSIWLSLKDFRVRELNKKPKTSLNIMSSFNLSFKKVLTISTTT